MADGVLAMSNEERDRSHLIRGCLEHRLCQREAAGRLGISVRQFKRLVRGWKRAGDASLASRQRGRVADRLGITPIHALAPQAKGRVERANQTLQDRLAKEMRLRGIASIDAANAFSASFIALWNKKFAVPPRDATSAHRP